MKIYDDDDHEWPIEFRKALADILASKGSMMQVLEEWGEIYLKRIEKEKSLRKSRQKRSDENTL